MRPALRLALLSCMAVAARAAAAECPPIENVDQVAARKLVFVGELHGTNESPRFVAALACRLSERADVVLALEMPANFQPDLDAAMKEPDARAAHARFEAMGFWDAKMQDGRRSAAWLDLLDSAWALNRQRAGVSIVAIDAPAGVREPRPDEHLAGRIRDTVRANPAAAVVVLAGNLHARRQVGTPWNKTFEPAGYFLRDLDLVTLNVNYVAGTAWNCTREGCGVNPVSREAPSGRQQVPKIELAPGDGAYDGIYQVGEVTASLPVRTQPAR